MDDEQGPWWTQPPEPSSDQQERLPEQQFEHPGLKLDLDDDDPDAGPRPTIRRIGVIPDPPVPAPAPSPPKPRWTVAPGVDAGPEPDADPGPDPAAEASTGTGPDLRTDRRRPPSEEARTETLPAMADDIFATFTPSDPNGIITGPIPSQSQPLGEIQPSVAVPLPADAEPERPRRTSPDPRTLLIGGAAVLVVAIIALLAVLTRGGTGATANRTPTPATKRTQADAVAASFGGQKPSGLALVGSSKAAAILAKAGQKGSGVVHEAWTWRDKNGTNLVVSTVESLPGKHFKLQVIHVAHVESDSPKPLRIMTEPRLPSCRGGGVAQFTKNSLIVRDLNSDDVAEIAAGWSSQCGSEKSSEVKLALITGGHKYIIRGNGVIGGKTGSAHPDPAAASWPKGFLPALQAVFHQLYY